MPFDEFGGCMPGDVWRMRMQWVRRERRADWRFAATIIAQSAGGKDAPPLRLTDLFPSLEAEPPTAEDLERKFASFEKAHNAREKTHGW